MTLSQDILAELAEIAPDSALAAARAVRERPPAMLREVMKRCLVSRITTSARRAFCRGREGGEAA
jgi:hypothetical protein